MTLTELRQHKVRPALAISVTLGKPVTVVALAGRADISTLTEVNLALARAIGDSEGPVVIDLAATEFIDTGTVRAFARAWEFLSDRSRRLTVRSPSRLTERILALLGLTHLIEPAGPTSP
jgi:anti-anti-sigma factor